MKRLNLILIAMFLFSCGGGSGSGILDAPKTQKVSLVGATSDVPQDLRCCSDWDDENEVCKEWTIPEAVNGTVTLRNENLVAGHEQAVRVRGCTVSFDIIDTTDDPPEISTGSNYVTCTPTLIEPGADGAVMVNIHQSLVSTIYNSYNEKGYFNTQKQEVFPYRMTIKFDIKGVDSGSYDQTVVMDIEFADFEKNEHDKCSTSGG